MKRILCLFTALLIVFIGFPYVCQAQITEEEHAGSREYSDPITVLDSVKGNANRGRSDQVQKTELDRTNSKICDESVGARDSRFTITKTLCNIKQNVRDYLQYIMYAGLAVATIFIIRNGFKLVTSPDREKQMGEFRKNIIYLIVGVILLISFYYIIDIFVSVINIISGD